MVPLYPLPALFGNCGQPEAADKEAFPGEEAAMQVFFVIKLT